MENQNSVPIVSSWLAIHISMNFFSHPGILFYESADKHKYI